jgi:hypothetical protein
MRDDFLCFDARSEPGEAERVFNRPDQTVSSQIRAAFPLEMPFVGVSLNLVSA